MTDWLRHLLGVSGPAADMARFQTAAAGAGGIPWVYPDLNRREEDQVYALLSPPDGSRGLPLSSARTLARLLRDAVEGRQQRLIAVSGWAKGCPFDLHALLPIPADLLRRGPDDPGSIAWMMEHWGVVQALRHVRLIPGNTDRRLRRSARAEFEFWASDWTPWAAIAALKRRWPKVVFAIRPDYGPDHEDE